MNEDDDDELVCSDEQWAMLCEAHAKAQKLVSDLIDRQKDLEAHPPDLAAQQLEQGKHAMNQAVASAQRMLSSIQEAMDIAAASRGQDRPDSNRAKSS
jgi:hypothetical protein